MLLWVAVGGDQKRGEGKSFCDIMRVRVRGEGSYTRNLHIGP